MSISIGNKAIDVFKIYDELIQAYPKEIDGYKSLIKVIEVMIDQKERDLQDIKVKAIALMKQSIASPGAATIQEAKTRKGKATNRLKDLAVGKTGPKLRTPGIKKTAKPTKAEKEIKCLYHSDSPASDIRKQLCSSCRWKLRSNGLMEYDKDPSVISFLKGETKSIPNIGQPMCPVHPEVPAYNKKTGLCQRCQSKARAIGVTDRRLAEDELDLLRNPSL